MTQNTHKNVKSFMASVMIENGAKLLAAHDDGALCWLSGEGCVTARHGGGTHANRRIVPRGPTYNILQGLLEGRRVTFPRKS